MIKLPTYKELGRLLLFAAVMLSLLAVGVYLYYMPRFNRSMINYVLFHPPDRKLNQRIEIGGVVGEHHKIAVSTTAKSPGAAITLDCLLLKAKEEKGIILYSQGVGSSINGLADHFKIATMLKLGYSVCIYDHEGYGLSSGECNLDRIVPDAIAAYDFLVKSLHYPQNLIVGYGESFGGGVTSELVKHRPLKAVILESTFISPKQWADDQAGFTVIYPSFLFMEPTFDNLSMLKGIHPPALLIVAGKDKSMPASHAALMEKEAVQPFQFVNLPTSNHALVSLADRDLYATSINSFLTRYGAGAVGSGKPL